MSFSPFIPFRPQTPIRAPSSSLPSNYRSPEVQIPVTRREKSSSPEPEFSESEPEDGQPRGMFPNDLDHQTTTSIDGNVSQEDDESDTLVSRSSDAFTHIREHVMSVAEEIKERYKEMHLVHFQAVVLDHLYNVLINWKKPYSERLSICMRRRVAYFASPENFLASLVSSFLLVHVFTTEAIQEMNLDTLHLTWDDWIEHDDLIDQTARVMSDEFASAMLHHIFYDEQNNDLARTHDRDFLSSVSAGLVREALVFGLCTRRSEDDFEVPHAGGRFDSGTMKVLGGPVERVNDRAVLIAIFPGVAMDGEGEEEGTVLEPVVVLEEEASHY